MQKKAEHGMSDAGDNVSVTEVIRLLRAIKDGERLPNGAEAGGGAAAGFPICVIVAVCSRSLRKIIDVPKVSPVNNMDAQPQAQPGVQQQPNVQPEESSKIQPLIEQICYSKTDQQSRLLLTALQEKVQYSSSLELEGALSRLEHRDGMEGCLY